MVSMVRLYVMLSYGIPCLILYLLILTSLVGSDSSQQFVSSFYSFILFQGVMDVIGYFISIMTYRLPLFMPFYDFFHEFEASWKTTTIYLVTFYSCCARDLSMIALALNRFTSIVYGNKTWTGRSRLLVILLSFLVAGALNFYNFDTEVQYQRVPMGDGTYVYFMILDETARPWLYEPTFVLSWALGSWLFCLAVYLLIGWNLCCGGGGQPEVEKRELRLLFIAVAILFADLPFVVSQIMSYLIDHNDMLAALDAVRQGSPIIPFSLDTRFFSVPFMLIAFDSTLRVKVLSTLGIGDKSMPVSSAST